MLLFILILLASLVCQLFLPWWIIAPIAFGLAFWKSASGRQAFLAGFAAIFALWFIAAYLPHYRNEGILTAKVAQLLGLPAQSRFRQINLPASFIVLIATALIGGLVGGLAAWSGFFWKQALSGSQGAKAA